MRIQHNIMAMSAYRNYTNNVSAMKKNLEKLSSGYKINRAGDDAAGLAISEKMRAQITGLETAQKNAKDGISLVQTAEGALTEVHDMLNRMVELATQSANGTYDNDTDRYQLQKEMDQLRAEIDRIADSSNFNGIMLLDGSMDAGGDIKYTAGSFQFEKLHPAGIAEGNVTLKPVGTELGVNTVLHTDGTKGGQNNAFSIDLHNVQLNDGGTIDIEIGDIKITVENTSGKDLTAKDLVDAIVNKKDGVNVTRDGAAIDKDNFDVGGAKFKLSANGTRLTFTQDKDDDTKTVDIPKEVTISDPNQSEATLAVVSGSADYDFSEKGKITLDLTGFDVTAPGMVTISAFGQEVELEITQDDIDAKETTPIAKLLAAKLAEKLNTEKGNIKDDANNTNVAMSAVTDNEDGTVTVTFSTSADLVDYTDADSVGLSVTANKFEDGESEDDATLDVAMIVDGVGSANWGHADWDGTGLVNAMNKELKFTIGGKTYTIKYIGQNGGAEATGEGEISNADLAAYGGAVTSAATLLKAIEGKLNEMVKADMDAKAAGSDSYTEYSDIKLTLNGTNNITATYDSTEKKAIGADKSFSGDYNKSTTVIETKSTGTADRLASTYFDLDKLLGPDGKIAEGTTITIGRDTYTFTYDTNKMGKDGYVVINGGEENPDSLKAIAEKLTKAAEKNGTYTVGFDNSNDNGRITITEVPGQTNFDLTTMEGIEKSLGFKIASTNPKDESKGLTLQIGDTADAYNQLKVNIKDCHTKALGIDLISISNQADAAEAVNAIKAAINYVSDVRGTLGATQNRLDHTINNLSVMTENIQDAESTIRDVDIAEEMMAYTKNNILIQSAQAMLAQANQVPQGVLQLLQ